jgi:two-component system invasion response regulator UvrY
MDVTMPVIGGLEATRQIISENAGVHVIGLSMHEENDMAASMREAGASAYLTKGGPPELLIAAIRACLTC